MQQFKSWKKEINWNKYQSKVLIERPNQYFDYLIDPSFEGVNRLIVLSFKNNVDRTGQTGHLVPKSETNDYIVMIDQLML